MSGVTREKLGIGRCGPGELQHWMNLIFETGQQPFLQGRRFTSCFVSDVNGAIVCLELKAAGDSETDARKVSCAATIVRKFCDDVVASLQSDPKSVGQARW